MKKRLMFAALSLLILLYFTGCQKNTDGEKVLWKKNEELAVGIKIGAWETKGILYLEDDAICFTHKNPSSPLFGMTERVSQEVYESEYRGIRWQSGEVDLQIGKILRLIQLTEEITNWKKSEDTIGGIPVTKMEAEKDQNFATVYLSKENTPLRLVGVIDSEQVEMNFSLEEEAFSFALA